MYKFIASLPNPDLIYTKIKQLKTFKSKIKLHLDIGKIKGKSKNIYRLRVGEIRFIFEVLSSKIIIKSADYRGRVYS